MTPAGMHQVRLLVQAKAGEEFFDRTGGISLMSQYAAPFERGELHCVVTSDRFTNDRDLAQSLRTLADRLHPLEAGSDGDAPGSDSDQGAGDQASSTVPTASTDGS